MEGRYRFGEFEFDTASGELRRLDEGDKGSGQRLAPQPARLLALLAERGSDLLSREEIKQGVWPGVEVDFDTSLHFCIRQIRSALGDSATEPRYVETLPRRGYRLLPQVERIEAKPTGKTAAAASPRWSLAIGLLIILGIAAVLVFTSGVRPLAKPLLRIGIMPFELQEAPNGIAETVLEELTTALDGRAEIVGPTSTTPYGHRDASMRNLAADYDLDYIVNGRFLDDERGKRMLAELIRASDGAHVWVQAYGDLTEGRRIGLEISGAVAAELTALDGS